VALELLGRLVAEEFIGRAAERVVVILDDARCGELVFALASDDGPIDLVVVLPGFEFSVKVVALTLEGFQNSSVLTGDAQANTGLIYARGSV